MSCRGATGPVPGPAKTGGGEPPEDRSRQALQDALRRILGDLPAMPLPMPPAGAPPPPRPWCDTDDDPEDGRT